MSAIPTNFVDNIGMFVNAAYLNNLGTEVNASTYARTLYGTWSSRPAAATSNAGAFYFCTDCDAVYRSDGSSWTKIRAGGYGGAAMADLPTSGWSNINLSTDTFADNADGSLLTVAANSSADAWRLRVRSLSPASSYTATFYLDPTFLAAGVRRAGIVLRNSASGNFVAFYTASGSQVTVDKWTGPTAFSATYLNSSSMIEKTPHWLRFRDDGTNRYAEFSYNGVDWKTAHSVGRTDFITPDQIGWGASNYSTGSTGYLRLRSLSGVA